MVMDYNEEFDCMLKQYHSDCELDFSKIKDVCIFISSVDIEINHSDDYSFNGYEYTGSDLIDYIKRLENG